LKPLLRVLIVDDEELARRLITEYLKPHTDMSIIGECENGFQAVQSITELEPDLIFLDIQMPKLSGIEVLQLTERHHGVIFSTAFEEFALQAFERHAIDYLLKPYSQQRFDQALEKARKLLHNPNQENPSSGQANLQNSNLQKLVHELMPKAERPQRLLIRDRGLVHVVEIAKLIILKRKMITSAFIVRGNYFKNPNSGRI